MPKIAFGVDQMIWEDDISNMIQKLFSGSGIRIRVFINEPDSWYELATKHSHPLVPDNIHIVTEAYHFNRRSINALSMPNPLDDIDLLGKYLQLDMVAEQAQDCLLYTSGNTLIELRDESEVCLGV